MSVVVFKTAPDRDCYVLWQTVNDCPVFIGDRADTVARLEAEMHPDIVATGLAQTDETGSSYPDGTGGWDDEGVAVGGECFPDGEMRFVPRPDLEEFVLAAAVNDVPRMVALSVEMEESGSDGSGV
ncbi:hypothetical protein ACU635_43575 [[Actinomadura] parvosata]|uniref:hypothetical protein n=1 Tax=[Actinomadura] parvosata TaxID=1955412 RepID=UPI00406CCC3F